MNENHHDSLKLPTERSAWSRFWSHFATETASSPTHQLYEKLVKHARLPIYYDKLDVPDTPEGRFEILALHVGLTVRRLCSLDPQGREGGQALFDLMITDLDTNLRELGVGDLSVGKQVKRLAGQFYARLAALTDVFDKDQPEALAPMLQTNIYGANPTAPSTLAQLTDIVLALEKALQEQRPDDLKDGRIELPDENALLAYRQQDGEPAR